MSDGDRPKKKKKAAGTVAPAPDVTLHRNALMGVRGLMKARLYQHAKTAGDVEDPTGTFAPQMISSLTSVYLHVATARTDANAFDVDACEELLESLAYSLEYSVKVEPSIFCDVCNGSDIFNVTLDPDGTGDPAHEFTGSFHRPLLWVWRELLLTMVLLETPEKVVVASVRRALLASPLYDCDKWRQAPRHTIDLLLRGGCEEAWDNTNHLNDAVTVAQKQCLPRLIALCKAHKKAFEHDRYDTYTFANDEEDVYPDDDDDDDDDDDNDDDDDDDDDDEEEY